MDKKELTCNKCGYTWTPRKDPKYCPLCKQLLYSIAEIVAKQKEKREEGK